MKHEFRIFEGDLYRYDMPAQNTGYYGLSNGEVLLRENYAIQHHAIDSVADLKATLRAGPYAWPGGYPLYFITSDGAALSFESVRAELYQVIYSIRHSLSDGWRVVACEANYEDAGLVCDHSGERIESAYGEG